MNPLIQFKTHTPELSDGFYHKDSPYLYAAHDEIGSLSDCPFPLKTPTFQVIQFGRITGPSKHSDRDTFAVVEYVKSCGHLDRERIGFNEGVADFEHYGTKFFGADYSIAAWERRIEYFRNTDCEVCSLVRHGVWIWIIGEGPQSRAKAISRTLFLLDANFSNWRELTPESEVIAKFTTAKRRSSA